MIVRKLFPIPIILIILLTLPAGVLADGGVVTPEPYTEVQLRSQSASIFWDGDTEKLVLATDISTSRDLSNMAWLIPVESKDKPEVTKGDDAIFRILDDLFEEKVVISDILDRGALSSTEQSGVDVIESKRINAYNITILKATNATELVNWLNANGYKIKPESQFILQDYCDKGYYFIANKIDLNGTNITSSNLDYSKSSSNGYVTSTSPSYAPNSSNPNYGNRSNSNYVNRSNIDYQLLKTPLMITFKPSEPMYPMKFSSINQGTSQIKVYVFSKTPVEDKNSLLKVQGIVENPTSHSNTLNTYLSKENITQRNMNYVTYLSYSGNLNQLTTDSVFVSKEYEPSLDPHWQPLWISVLLKAGYILGFIIMTLAFFGGLYILLMIFLKIIERIKKLHSE